MKSKNPFGSSHKQDRSKLPDPPLAQAADKPSWVDLIAKKDANEVKKALKHEKVMQAVHDKLLGATGLHSKTNKK